MRRERERWRETPKGGRRSEKDAVNEREEEETAKVRNSKTQRNKGRVREKTKVWKVQKK